jgi:predicted ATPase
MAITEIGLSNFKSYHKSSVSLGKFNVVVGANASGKSNLIQFFKFLKDINDFGIDDAISMQGGAEYIFNANHQDEDCLSCRLVDNKKHEFAGSSDNGLGLEIFNTVYEITIRMSEHKTYVLSVEEKFTYECDFFSYKKAGRGKTEKSSKLGSGEIVILNNNGKVTYKIKLPEAVNEEKLTEALFPIFFLNRFLEKRFHVGRRQTLLEADLPEFLYFVHDWGKRLREISIFDIDPKLTKKAQPITGRHELEPDGSNLAAVIRRIGRNATTRKQLENIIGDLLPFVEGLSVKKLADNLFVSVREKFASENLFPAFLLSDGTINLTALSILLFFENKPLKIIEEPERNIHPHLISKVMNLMRDASTESQIITTTHNPEIVRYSSIDDLILVTRNSFGDSVLSKPAEKEEVRHFLKNNLGIEELYIQNILERYANKVSE